MRIRKHKILMNEVFFATSFAKRRQALQAALSYAVWLFVSLLSGALIGLSAIILPPAGAFGFVALAAVLLLWAMPDDIRLVPSVNILRKLVIISIIFHLSVPSYYAISAPGLPWISIHRLALLPMILSILLYVSVSPEARTYVLSVMSNSKFMFIFAFIYAFAAFISVFLSRTPPASLSRFSSLIIEWYLPALGVLIAFRNEKHIRTLFITVSCCAIFICFVGIMDFIYQRRTFFTFMPSWMFASLAESNPAVAGLLRTPELRNGMYRASSVYGSPLSFGEFAGMVLPFGYYYIAYGRGFEQKLFGICVTLIVFSGIVGSGSRGGYLMFMSATPIFFALWLMRIVRTEPRSLIPAFAVTLIVPVVIGFIGGVLFWGRLHNLVIGGGYEQYSTDSRTQEWNAALPHIMGSPIFGNGFGLGADVVGFQYPGAATPTLDSSLISIFVETGIVGIVSFFGTIIAAVAYAIATFIKDPDRTWLSALAAAIVGYGVYRLVLSQVDNNFLFFIFVALVGALRATEEQALTSTDARPQGALGKV